MARCDAHGGTQKAWGTRDVSDLHHLASLIALARRVGARSA